jgi:pimeloyl-ACP methyl ester carboxylesterase
MPTAEILPGLSLHYKEYNPDGGKSILLLHGLGATCDSWQLQIPDLESAGYHVIAPDSRGFGMSGFPGGRITIQVFAEDFKVLLNKLLITRAVVCGISMGGVIALQMALQYPELVEKLVLVNSYGKLRPDRLTGWGYFILRFLLVQTLGLQTQAEAVAWRIFPKREQQVYRQELVRQILQANPVVYRAAMRALARFDVEGRLDRVRAPTLIITGERDQTISPRNQKVLAERIPGARQVVISGAGHAVTADKPAEFNKALIEFITSEDSS